jgi:hypothetical protein
MFFFVDSSRDCGFARFEDTGVPGKKMKGTNFGILPDFSFPQTGLGTFSERINISP